MFLYRKAYEWWSNKGSVVQVNTWAIAQSLMGWLWLKLTTPLKLKVEDERPARVWKQDHKNI